MADDVKKKCRKFGKFHCQIVELRTSVHIEISFCFHNLKHAKEALAIHFVGCCFGFPLVFFFLLFFLSTTSLHILAAHSISINLRYFRYFFKTHQL